MANNNSERPLNPIAARAFDERQARLAHQEARKKAHRALLHEIKPASIDMGRETRTGLVTSGIIRQSGPW